MLKFDHKNSRVPFAPTQRNRVDAGMKVQTMNQCNFKWKVPTYDINP